MVCAFQGSCEYPQCESVWRYGDVLSAEQGCRSQGDPGNPQGDH